MASLIRLHRRLFAPSDRADILCHLGRTSIIAGRGHREGILSISELSWGARLLWEKIETNLDSRREARGRRSFFRPTV